MTRTLKILLIIALIMGLQTLAYAEPVNVVQGSKAPLFVGIDFDDAKFDLNDYYGKTPIILSFFSVRCVSCLTVVKKLEAYKTQKKLTDEIKFLYISLDDWKKEPHIPSVWKEVFKKKQMRINDGKRQIGKLYEVDTLPVTIIIDKTGTIIYRRDDYNRDFEKEINKALDSLLSK